MTCFGSPGFLAAYNAGPGPARRLPDRAIARCRTRRGATSRAIGTAIGDSQPEHLSSSSQYAMNQLPINIPAGPRYPRGRTAAPVALADNRPSRGTYERGVVQLAALPEPPRYAPPPPAPVVVASALPHGRGGFHLIPQAMADTVPTQHNAAVGGTWAIQVGAFGNESLARAATDSARHSAQEVLGAAHPAIGTVRQANGTLYRARLIGLSREAAVQACELFRMAAATASCCPPAPRPKFQRNRTSPPRGRGLLPRRHAAMIAAAAEGTR